MHHAHQNSSSSAHNLPLATPVTNDCGTLFLVACDRFCDSNNDDPLSATQFSEAFYLLIDDVSTETKQAAARAIANTGHIPRAVALYLAMETIDIAAPVLARSSTLGQLDLLRIIEAKGNEHAEIIAERNDLGRTIIERLYALQDDALDAKLEVNESVTSNYEEKSVETLFATIHGQLDLSTKPAIISQKAEVEQSVSKSASHKLLQAAARGKRLDINTDQSDDIAVEFGDQDFGDSVERAARLGSRQSVGVLLTKFLNLELNTAFQVLDDKSGDTLAVALKSQNVSSEQSNRILMLTFPQIGLSVHNAQRSMQFYDQLTFIACENAVAQWPKAARPAHEPVQTETKPIKTPRDTGRYQDGLSVEQVRDERRSA